MNLFDKGIAVFVAEFERPPNEFARQRQILKLLAKV
jgi:hypothetical protein